MNPAAGAVSNYDIDIFLVLMELFAAEHQLGRTDE